MPRIFFINRFYWPDEPATAQLLTDLAESLAARGFDIHVVTSRPTTTPPCPDLETRNGVTIHRLASQRGPKAFAFLRFIAEATWFIFQTPEPGDVIVLLTDPPLLNIPASLVADARGLPTLHWVHDIYPEIALALTPHRWLALARPLRNLALRRSRAVVTLGTDMAAHLAAQHTPTALLHVSPNWCPDKLPAPTADDIAELRAEWGLADKLIVAYSGNLGRVHALDPVIDLAAQLRLDHHIAFLFIGHGAQKAALQSRMRALDLENVHFLPPQPRAALAATLAAADVHLVTLHDDCAAYVFPSKLYGIAAAARPMLFIGPPSSEVARLIQSAEMGAAIDAADIAILADTLRAWHQQPALRQQLAANASAFAQATPSLDHATSLWADLLNRNIRDDSR